MESSIKCEVCCPICKKWISNSVFKYHYHKCLSIEYMNKKSLEYKGVEIAKPLYFKLTDDEFNQKYDEICEYVFNNTKDELEKNYLENYLNSKNKRKVEQ